MSTSGEAAEEIVRMSLQGVEVVGKMSMDGAERLIGLVIQALKNPKQSKGKASLSKMLKSQKPVKVFELRDKDLKKFCEEAKKYGVMYHILKDKKSKNGKCDIMVRAEDSAKVNRIFQRFNLGANNKAILRADLEKSKGDIKQPQEKDKPTKSIEDKFVDELFEKPLQKEQSHNTNPSQARMEKSRPSERSYGIKDNRIDQRDNPSSRPSVRKQLDDIKKQMNKDGGKTKAPQKTKGAKKNVRSR